MLEIVAYVPEYTDGTTVINLSVLARSLSFAEIGLLEQNSHVYLEITEELVPESILFSFCH